MNPDPALPVRLKAASPELGQASQAEIERRATELALSDGRDAFTDADLARAAEELAGGSTPTVAPEADPATEEITAWDEPPAQSGHRVPTVPLEDETSVAEQLVQDGIEEAEHDVRVAAAEDDEADPAENS